MPVRVSLHSTVLQAICYAIPIYEPYLIYVTALPPCAVRFSTTAARLWWSAPLAAAAAVACCRSLRLSFRR